MKRFAVNIALDACVGDGRWEWIYIKLLLLLVYSFIFNLIFTL